MAQLAEGSLLQLPDAFPRQVHESADLLQGQGIGLVETEVEADDAELALVQIGHDYMQFMWSEYVLGLNQKRQRKAIYDPLQKAFRLFSDYCFGREHWAARWQSLQLRFRGEFFTRQTAVDAGMLIFALAASFFAVRFLVRLAAGICRRILKLQRRARRPKIEFYRRLESLLARRGLRRRPNQTPREFAVVAANQLRGPLALPAAAAIPAAVVDLFYRVRFGQGHLDTEDTQRLENLLQQLQQALAGDRKR